MITITLWQGAALVAMSNPEQQNKPAGGQSNSAMKALQK